MLREFRIQYPISLGKVYHRPSLPVGQMMCNDASRKVRTLMQNLEYTDVDEVKNVLNSFHVSIQFTSEPETNQTLPFLDILIRRLPTYNRSWFSTSVHRKSTYTGLILKWHSFVPIERKRSTISSMIYRAIRITSDYNLLHKEFTFIRMIAVSNGYPLLSSSTLSEKPLTIT